MEQQNMIFKSSHEHKLDYLIYLPSNYESMEKWPLILFLHGAGERGSNPELVKKYGIQEKLLKNDEFPFVVISPQCPEAAIWEMQFDLLTELLEEVQRNYNIDEERIYLTGLSMGGYGTWHYAMLNPQKFAAIVPVCGGAMIPKMAKLLKDIPTWVFHGEKDEAVSIDESRRVVEVLRKYNENVKFTVYPDAGHEVCTIAYENDELYDWLLQQRKKK